MTCEAFNTIWLSDVHLGSRDCRIGLFLDFLRNTRCETLYLAGDIIDLESIRRSFYWPDPCRSAAATPAQEPEGPASSTCRGTTTRSCGRSSGAFRQHRDLSRAVHTTRAGRRLLVLHGDEFDTVSNAVRSR